MTILKRLSLTAAVLAIMGVVSSVSAPSAQALTEDQARTHVEYVANSVLNLINAPGDISSKEVAFRALLLETANVRQIAGFAVGRYRRVMTPAQKDEYVDLFVDYTIRAYTRQFSEYQGEVMNVVRVQADRRRGYYVRTLIGNGRSAPLNVEWIVSDRNRSGQTLIDDMVIEGVSLAQLTRDEFTAMLNRRRGDVPAFLNALRTAIDNL